MKKLFTSVFLISVGLASCSSNNVFIGDSTFVHGDKVYKIIDNEPREIGDLSSSAIKKLEVSKPVQTDLGSFDMSFVKHGATASLKSLYRGNFLYYVLRIDNLNDLRENFYGYGFNVEFKDQYGFILHSVAIPINELVGSIGEDRKIQEYVYKGKTEMSTDISKAISTYSIESTVEPIPKR